VGVLLGVALNLANALPDIEEDAAGDAKTLAVVLGVKRSLLLCRLLIVAGAMLIGMLAVNRVVPVQPWVLIPTLLVTGLAVICLFLFSRDERSTRGRKLHFYMSALTCIVLASGWLIGVIV
jgi:4-hydroxybenzoate polyprenyltransferase